MLDPFAVANLLVNILMHCNIYHHSVVVTLPQPSNFKGQCRILAKRVRGKEIPQLLSARSAVELHHQHHHHHLRLASLQVCSATGRQQPPEWSIPTARGSRGRSAPSSSRSFAVIPVVSSNTQKARKSRSAQRLHCRPFGRYAQIG